MFSKIILLFCTVLLTTVCFGQTDKRFSRQVGAETIIGPRNVPLDNGAKALISGDDEEGVRLTLIGLEIAVGKREHEAALSNLCAGYVKLGKYSDALKYCNLLLARNDKHWRGYNNRAVVYIQTKQWEKAHLDLTKGEELNPGARTLKVARSMYMDAVYPVREEVEIDDRQKKNDDDSQS